MTNPRSTDERGAARVRVSAGVFFRLAGASVAWLAALLIVVSAFGGEPDAIRVVSWNVRNYLDPGAEGPVKPPEARAAVVETLRDLRPDICVLIEMGADSAPQEVRGMLRKAGWDMPYLSVVRGADTVRHIVFLSRIRPAVVEHHTDLTYRLRGQTVPVQRGFGHCVFQWPAGYRLHVIAAHLKSKRYDPLGQTDMRRYEARQLHYIVAKILRQSEDANILVVGDLNDTPNSSPLKTLYTRRSRAGHQLYDLRPLDRWGFCWTHFWSWGDTYERIDYFLASRALLPEIRFQALSIPFREDWYTASDHRPIVCEIVPRDQPLPADLAPSLFPENIRHAAPPE